MRVFRKRRDRSLTNYKRRIALIKGDAERLVVRKTNRSVIVQIVRYEPDGDKIICSTDARELKKYGWETRCNIPTAYLSGLLTSKKFKDRGRAIVFDIGLYKPIKDSVVFAAAKGCVDGGLQVASNIESNQDRLSGKHISAFMEKASSEKEKYKNQFSKYSVKSIEEKFKEVKERISKE
jgi:Ribosomal protein L18